ncbi:MAG: hypothetical protein Q8M65_10685, partial [Rhodoglobus sp.]|nr:hypothetical protein [Rhodoglobus sp.]
MIIKMELLGLTWDHPRGIDPLRAVSEEYERANGTRVRWEARPLWSFEDTPLTELSERYDILAIDHPSIGDAVKAGAIVPLDAYLSAEQLADRAGDSAGASYLSYSWQGQQWALGVDAACMVTAFLSGEVDEADIPAHWSDIAGFSARVGRESVLLPANPTHLLCT